MFVHLRLHTEFSVVDGTCRIEDVLRVASEQQQAALAITDLDNLFGAVKFYKEARKRGVKPLLGTEVWLESLGKDTAAPTRMVLLVQNQQGYLNVCELLARAWTQHAGAGPAVVRLAWLRECQEGLIVLSGAQAGPVNWPCNSRSCFHTVFI